MEEEEIVKGAQLIATVIRIVSVLAVIAMAAVAVRMLLRVGS